MFDILLRTPARAWPVWLVALLVPTSVMVAAWFYYPALLASGTLDPNADSIGIPIFQAMVSAVIVTPIVMGITAICLRRYRGRTPLNYWDRKRPARSFLVSLLFALPIITLITSTVYEHIQGWPWYEYLWDIVSLSFVAWLILLRPAVLDRRSAGDV